MNRREPQGTAHLSLLRLRSDQLSSEAWRSATARFPELAQGPGRHCVVLRTCERLEVYGSSLSPHQQSAVESSLGTVMERLVGSVALRHLIGLASGLDSRLIGEPQILGQLRRAIDQSRQRSAADRPPRALLDLMQRALRAGRFVRRRSGLEALRSSYAGLAAHRVSGTPGAVAVLGSGALARELVDALLRQPGDRDLFVFARHPQHVSLPGGASDSVDVLELDRLDAGLPDLQVIVAATASPRLLLHRHQVLGRRSPLLAIDLGSPANLDPELTTLPGVERLGLRELAALAPERIAAQEFEAQRHLDAEVNRELERRRLELPTLGRPALPSGSFP